MAEILRAVRNKIYINLFLFFDELTLIFNLFPTLRAKHQESVMFC